MDLTNMCVQCHPNCATCSDGNDEFACTSCTSPFVLDPSRNNCFFQCPPNTYKETPTMYRDNNCIACHTSCQTCYGGDLKTDCLTCPANRPLENPITITRYEDSGVISSSNNQIGECTLACQPGKFYNNVTS
jgi:hypothetical protein